MAAIIMMAAIGAWAVSTDRLSYVVTHGVSMNPVYYAGDLVVLTKAESYEVGQIAAYHGSDGRVEVLHRIIGGDGTAGFVLKGDNNESIDNDKPTANDIIGRAVLHIPNGGNWLQPLLSPTGLGMLGFLFASGGTAAARSRRDIPRGRRKKRVKGMSGGGGSWATVAAAFKAVSRLNAALRALAVIAAVCGVFGMLLGALGWIRPATESITGTGKPGESMTFSYSAKVPRSAAYDGIEVNSPEPIFRKLANAVDLHMNYVGAPGRIEVTARLSAQNGWRKTLQLSQPKQFTGSRYTTAVQLDLGSLDQRVKEAGEAIGADLGVVTLAVTAQIRHGDATMFEPALSLNLTPLQLTLAGGSSSLVVNQSSNSAGTAVRDRHIGAFGYDVLTASKARKYSAFLILAALVGAGVVAMMALGHVPLRTRAQIQRRYPHLLVPVEPMANPPGKPVVLVETFPALVKLAEKYGQMILTWTRPDGSDDFVVRDEGITYRFRIPAQVPAPETPTKAPEPTPTDDLRSAGTGPVPQTSAIPVLPFGPEPAASATVRPGGPPVARGPSEAGGDPAQEDPAKAEPLNDKEPRKRAAPRERAAKTTAATAPRSRTAAAKSAAAKATDATNAASRSVGGVTTTGKAPTKRSRPAAAKTPERLPESDQPSTPEFAEQVSAVIWANTAPEEPASAPADTKPVTEDEPAGNAEAAGRTSPNEERAQSPSAEAAAAAPAAGHAGGESRETAETDATTATSKTGTVEKDETIEPVDVSPEPPVTAAQAETTNMAATKDPEPQPAEKASKAEPVGTKPAEPTAEAVAAIHGTQPAPPTEQPAMTAHAPAQVKVTSEESDTELKMPAKHRATAENQPAGPPKATRSRKRAARRNASPAKAGRQLTHEPTLGKQAQPAPGIPTEAEPGQQGQHDQQRLAEHNDPTLGGYAQPALAERKATREAMEDLADRNRPIDSAVAPRSHAGVEPDVDGPRGEPAPPHEPIYDFLPPGKRPGANPGDDESDIDADLENRPL